MQLNLFILSAVSISIDAKYCFSDDSDDGLIVVDIDKGKDNDVSAEIHFDFLDTTTKGFNVNLTETWRRYSSVSPESPLNCPVFDQRWAKFESNYKQHVSFDQLVKNPPNRTTLFFSVRLINGSDDDKILKGGQWSHICAKNGKVSYYNKSANHCLLLSESTHISRLYNSSVHHQALWKLHNYTYWYTDKATESYTFYAHENCASIENGCFQVFLASCEKCETTIKLQSDLENKTVVNNIRGNGGWKTIRIPLLNFTTCFNASITARTTDQNSSTGTFWAIDPLGHISTNGQCEENWGYFNISEVHFNSSGKLSCETSSNRIIEFSSTLHNFTKIGKHSIETSTTAAAAAMTPSTSSLQPLHALILVLPVLLIATVVLVLCLRYSCFRTPSRSRRYHSDAVELISTDSPTVEAGPVDCSPVKSRDYIEYIRKVFLPKNKQLELQFERLQSGVLKSAIAAHRPENVEKNKFPQIYPYDDSRVKLGPGEEYINASYVSCYNNRKEYIVSQDPLGTTMFDFFTMIWQERVKYAVMVSSSRDSYQPYWPELDELLTCGDFEVAVIQVRSYHYHHHRTLEICRDGRRRQLNQLHFHAWSSHKLSSNEFVEFMDQVLKIPHDSSPVLFHCMSGIGRSAVILLCDVVLRRAPISGTFDFFAATNRLRECRLDMVHKLEYYRLAHLIVYQMLKNPGGGWASD